MSDLVSLNLILFLWRLRDVALSPEVGAGIGFGHKLAIQSLPKGMQSRTVTTFGDIIGSTVYAVGLCLSLKQNRKSSFDYYNIRSQFADDIKASHLMDWAYS